MGAFVYTCPYCGMQFLDYEEYQRHLESEETGATTEPSTDWGWPWDIVQGWFQDLWNWVSEAAVSAVSAVSGWLNDAVKALQQGLTDAGVWIWDQVSGALEGLRAALDGLGAALSKGLSDLQTWFGDNVITPLSNAVAGVADDLGKLGSAVGEGLGKIADDLGTWAGSIVSDVGKALGEVGAGLTAAFDGAVSAIGGGIADLLKGAAEAFGSGLQALISWVMDKLGWLASGVAGVLTAVKNAIWGTVQPVATGIMNALTAAVSPGSPPEDVKQQAQAFADAYMKRMAEILKVPAKSVPTLGELMPAAARVVALNMGAAVLGNVAGLALDQAHPLKNIGFREVAGDLINSIQMPAVIGPLLAGPIWPSLFIPLRYRWNESYPTSVPDPRDLTSLASKALLAEDEYKQVMKFHALDESWSSRMLADSYKVPNFRDLQVMSWRGLLSTDGVKVGLQLGGVHPNFIEGYVGSLPEIPGSGDLIRFMVREVIAPEDFYTWMEKQGYSRFWSDAFYVAHWVLPAFDKLVDARHRGVISEAELDKFIVWHDYSPTPRPGIDKSDVEIMRALLKTPIPRVDLRRGWELGVIVDEELEERFRWLGYEDDSPLMAEIARMEALESEIGKERDEWLSDFKEGFIDEATLRANLEEIGVGEPRAGYYVTAARKRRERDHKKELINYYLDGYAKDLITMEDLEQRVSEILVDPDVVKLLVARAYVKKYVKPKA